MTLESVIASLPRVPLVGPPTAVNRLERFSRAVAPDGPRIWIKRDDRTQLALGGNKLRKLELLIGAATAAGADTVITSGAAQSNHACQTAAAARCHGLRPVLLLRGAENSASQGNLQLDRLFGAEVRLDPSPPEDWASQVAAELRAGGATPYVIPYGGSNELGALGYAAGAMELSRQCTPLGVNFDEIVVTSSSGGTQAGLSLAVASGDLPSAVLGVSVDLGASELGDTVHRLASSAAELYELTAPDRDEIITDDAYIGPGYGEVNGEALDAIELLAQTEGILTDPVYTGKALWALVDLARQGRWTNDQDVLFWHTGGVAALFADRYGTHFSKRLVD